MFKRKWAKRILLTVLLVFISMNIIAYLHAYKFTHFSNSLKEKTDPKKVSLIQKVGLLFTGVNNPKPVNKKQPSKPFQNISIQSNKRIECWLINRDSAKGTVILFHGYGGEKSSMLDKAEVFDSLGYNTLLVDFMGSGSSEGNSTTIGFHEAEQVKSSFEWIKNKGEGNIILFGTSMGAAAIMKAMNDYNLNVSSIIIECPFSTMLKTVKNRFRTMGIPSFPMAHLLVFWGGAQNNFNAFSHNPSDYAKTIKVPTLLLYGEKDDRVDKEETATIFSNLQGRKKLAPYPLAGHENYLIRYKREWIRDIEDFLNNN